jgi:hypothetical protein
MAQNKFSFKEFALIQKIKGRVRLFAAQLPTHRNIYHIDYQGKKFKSYL